MPPLPVNNTLTLFIDYANSYARHSMSIRCTAPFNASTVEEEIGTWLTALGPLFSRSTITGLRQRNEDASVTFPITGTLVGLVFGNGDASPEGNAGGVTFVGRTPTPHRSRVTIFGYKGPLSNFRLTTAESPEITAAVADMNAATDTFFAIDGEKPLWYPFADIKQNNYWVRRARA